VTDPFLRHPDATTESTTNAPNRPESPLQADSQLERDAAVTLAALQQCWRRIGVSGDRSCPELEAYIHCRNCPVIAEAARAFFDREAPEGYVESWERLLEEPEEEAEADGLSALIFRVGSEWLALPIGVLVEVTSMRTLHRIPHREGTVLEGLVNVRGQLQVCVSLHRLLGLHAASSQVSAIPENKSETKGAAEGSAGRLLVVERQGTRGGERWVFGVDEVAGVQSVDRSDMRTTPSTVNQSSSRFCRTLFKADDRIIGMLDEARIFDGLRDLVAS